MSYIWQADEIDVSTYWRAFDSATGADYAGAEIAHNATGLTIAYARYQTAAVSAVTGGSPAPADLTNAGSAHTDWGWCRVLGPFYRADFPDGAFASGVPLSLLAVYGVSGVVFAQVSLADISSSDPRAATPTVTEIANAGVEAQIDALETYNRTTNTAATITGPINGATTLTITTDAAYEPIKSIA